MEIKDLKMKDLRAEIKRRERLRERPEPLVDTDILSNLYDESFKICEEYITKVESDRFRMGMGEKLLQNTLRLIYGEEAIEWLKYMIEANREEIKE